MRRLLKRMIGLIRIIHHENLALMMLMESFCKSEEASEKLSEIIQTFDELFRENNEIWR